MSTGYFYAFATLFCWTVSTFVLAKLSRLQDVYTLNKATLFFGVFILGVVVCMVDKLAPWELFTVPSFSNWLWLSVSGIIGKSVGDYCGFYALRILGATRRSMVATMGPGFIWLSGLIILGENMNWLGLSAMLLTIVALVLLISNSAEQSEVKQDGFGKPIMGLLFGAAGAALTGVAFILSKMTFNESGNNISAFHATWIRILTAFAAIYIFDVLRKQRAAFIKPFLLDQQKGWLLFMGILFGSVLGLSFSLIAISKMNAAAAYTIFSLVPVAVMLVSRIIYKKKITLKSLLYSMLAIAGVMILLWRDQVIKYF